MKTICSERIFAIGEIGFLLVLAGLVWLSITTATGKWQRGRYAPVLVGAGLCLFVYVMTSTEAGRGVCKRELENESN